MKVKFKVTPEQVYNIFTSYSKNNQQLSDNPYLEKDTREFHAQRAAYQKELIDMLLEITDD